MPTENEVEQAHFLVVETKKQFEYSKITDALQGEHQRETMAEKFYRLRNTLSNIKTPETLLLRVL